MPQVIRIGTRESQLAVWQASQVQDLLSKNNFKSELVFIKSEGDIDLKTPLYEMGVQGIFTRSLDSALLNNKIDIAVHSMKDVPIQLAAGLTQAAVLERASYKDLLVFKDKSVIDKWENKVLDNNSSLVDAGIIATSSIRRKAQWLNRYPNHCIENLRGNVNTRLNKLEENNWDAAIFAAAGLERIGLRPAKSIELNWMLPAPAQGAIMVVCRQHDNYCEAACANFNHADTALCTKIERDFLKILLGGCSTPISALAVRENETIHFKGNIFSVDGKEKVEIEKSILLMDAADIGKFAAQHIIQNGGQKIMEGIRNAAS